MANLHITHLVYAAGELQIPQMPPVYEDVVAIGASAASSAVFKPGVKYVCLTPKADCHVSFGKAPTATTSTKPLTAGNDYFFGVTPGDKVSVIAAS